MKKRQKRKINHRPSKVFYQGEMTIVKNINKPNMFDTIAKEKIRPLMNRYGEVLKKHGHNITILPTSKSMTMNVLPSHKYNSPSDIDWGERDPYVKFTILNNAIEATSYTVINGVPSPGRAPKKRYENISDFTEDEIDSFIAEVIKEIIKKCNAITPE